MRIAVGADHQGYLLRREVMSALQEAGHEVLDLGTDGPEPVDYPDCARSVAEAVAGGQAERGVLICGSGAGVSVAANKVRGVRAAAVHDVFTAHQCVEHDDVNVLCMGAQVVGKWLALEIVRSWASARFDGAERHRRRLEKVEEIERRWGGQ
ncbi:MAG: ribose 5-phosphate isomerase B [Planctomycetota bacterium]|jgi:ribose 5-phosphate isomerase B